MKMNATLTHCNDTLRRMFLEIDHTIIDMACYKYHINFGVYFDDLESVLNEMSNQYYYNNEYNNIIQNTISMYQEYLKTLEKYKLVDN